MPEKTRKTSSIKVLSVIKNNKAEAVLLSATSALYIFMMLFRLTFSPLWFDEYIERIISQMSIKSGEMYANIIVTFQPPLYNFLMHFWLMISTDIFWFRLFNVLLGIVTGACVYFTIRRLYGYKPAAFSLILLSCCYQYIYCVQECSEYQLMVMFVSLIVYFYVRTIQDKKYFDALLFVFFAICAMYSQYGAMFIVIPFLGIFYIQVLLYKNKKDILLLTLTYVFSLFAAAAPLYFLYAKKQLIENAIAEHTIIRFGILELFGVFLEPGKIVGYLFCIPDNGIFNVLLSLAGILFFALSLYIILKKIKTPDNIPAYLLLALILGYVLHYFLVIFQVYAMVHPGQSGGFYARYSYFYIPLIIVCIAVIITELKRMLIDNSGRKVKLADTVIILVFLVTALFFIPNIMKNWHKTYDDIIAYTWVDNKGFEKPTYLIGQAKYGFDFYIRDVYGDLAAVYAQHESQLDVNNMPDDFWLWRTGWGGEAFNMIVLEAKNQGYTADVIYDFGEEGQLAHVTRKY